MEKERSKIQQKRGGGGGEWGKQFHNGHRLASPSLNRRGSWGKNTGRSIRNRRGNKWPFEHLKEWGDNRASLILVGTVLLCGYVDASRGISATHNKGNGGSRPALDSCV